MNRYAIENLFGIEGLNIAWYGLIIACGMVLGFALAIYRCRKTGINKEHIYNLALWLIPVCIICARAYYVIFEWDKLTVTAPSGKKEVLENTAFIPDEYGIYAATPYNGGIAGADCSFFIHDGLNDMFRHACLSVKQNRDITIGKNAEGKEIFKPTHLTYRGYEDYNLCEHAMWCWADLRSRCCKEDSGTIYPPRGRFYAAAATALRQKLPIIPQ